MKPGSRYLLPGWIAYFASYLLRQNLSPALAGMVGSGDVPARVGGWMSMAFFISYAFGQIVNGLLADRLDPRKMILLGLGSGCLCNLAVSRSTSPVLLVALWGLNGYSLSMTWPAVLKTFTLEKDDALRRKNAVHITSSMTAGTFVSYGLSILLLRLWNWRCVFLGSGLLALALVCVYAVITRGSARQYKPVGKGPAGPRKLRSLIPVLLAFALPSAAHGVLKDGLTTWSPTYLTTAFGLSASLSATVSLVLPLLNLSGAYIAAWLNRRLKNREEGSCTLCFGAAACLLMSLLLSERANVWLTILFLGLTTTLMMAVNTILINLLPMRYAKDGMSATVSGALNAVAYLGAGLAGLQSGVCLENQDLKSLLLFWVCAALVGGLALAGSLCQRKGKQG